MSFEVIQGGVQDGAPQDISAAFSFRLAVLYAALLLPAPVGEADLSAVCCQETVMSGFDFVLALKELCELKMLRRQGGYIPTELGVQTLHGLQSQLHPAVKAQLEQAAAAMLGKRDKAP